MVVVVDIGGHVLLREHLYYESIHEVCVEIEELLFLQPEPDHPCLLLLFDKGIGVNQVGGLAQVYSQSEGAGNVAAHVEVDHLHPPVDISNLEVLGGVLEQIVLEGLEGEQLVQANADLQVEVEQLLGFGEALKVNRKIHKPAEIVYHLFGYCKVKAVGLGLGLLSELVFNFIDQLIIFRLGQSQIDFEFLVWGVHPD